MDAQEKEEFLQAIDQSIDKAVNHAIEAQDERIKAMVDDSISKAIKAQDDRLGLKSAEGEQERNKQAFLKQCAQGLKWLLSPAR